MYRLHNMGDYDVFVFEPLFIDDTAYHEEMPAPDIPHVWQPGDPIMEMPHGPDPWQPGDPIMPMPFDLI